MARPAPTHVDDPRALGARVRTLRRDRGLTLSQLAFDGCSVSFLARIEKGDRVPSAVVLTRLAERLGVAPEHLAGRSSGGSIASGRILVAEMAVRMREPDAERQLELLLSEAEAAGDGHARSRALEGLAVLAAEHSRDERAAGLLEQARASDPAATPRVRPGLYEELGRAYAAQGDLARAIAVLREALEDARRPPADASGIVRFGLFLASALTDQGDFAGAEQVLAEVLSHESALADPASRARLAWTLARTYAEQGRSRLAERYARTALAEYESSEEAYRLGRAHLFLGQILLDQGRHDDATLQLDAATALMRTGGPTTELASLALERARAALMGSDPAAAAEAAREALDHTEASEPSTAGGAYALMARVALAQGRLEDARFLCGRALEMLDGTAGPQHRGDVLRVLAMVEQRAGDLPAALDALWRSANPAEHPPAHRYGANRRTLSPE